MKIVVKRIYTVCVLSVVLSLTGCNAVEGAGRDVEEGGEAIQGVAD